MSTFTLRDISIDPFDPQSIEMAHQQILDLQERLAPAMEQLVAKLAEKGVEIARAELIFFANPAYDTGELSETVRAVINKGEATVAAGYKGGRNKGFYAAFVEFGTGSVGHPGDTAHRQNGWVYYNDRTGRFTFTMGMAARPFMHNTYEDLIEEAEAAGGRILADYLM